MTLLGWLLAYWGLWAVLGSFVMMIRFQPWCEEWQQVRDLATLDKLKLTYVFLCSITLWPREYRQQEFMERFGDDEDDENADDEDNWPPTAQ